MKVSGLLTTVAIALSLKKPSGLEMSKRVEQEKLIASCCLSHSRGNTAMNGAGLGIDRPAELTKNDDEYDAYRKRMMLAYRFRPNPLVTSVLLLKFCQLKPIYHNVIYLLVVVLCCI